jgi:hypothetical protein
MRTVHSLVLLSQLPVSKVVGAGERREQWWYLLKVDVGCDNLIDISAFR